MTQALAKWLDSVEHALTTLDDETLKDLKSQLETIVVENSLPASDRVRQLLTETFSSISFLTSSHRLDDDLRRIEIARLRRLLMLCRLELGKPETVDLEFPSLDDPE